MKTFREFIAEQVNHDHHDEAVKLLKTHAHGALVQKHTDLSAEEGKGHLGAVNGVHVADFHVALKKAGFSHQGSGPPAFDGASSSDREMYAHYKKGGTSVFVSSKPNTFGRTEDEAKYIHHHVEIATPNFGKTGK